MTKKLLLKDGLRIGKTELDLIQRAALENNAEILAATTGALPAVLTTRTSSGVVGPELRVSAVDSSGALSVQAGTAVFSSGVTVTLDNTTSVAVGTNVSNYKVILTAVETSKGPGIFSMAPDGLTLTYTPATGLTTTADDLYNANDYIRLTKGLTVYGVFPIAAISGNTVTLAQQMSTSATTIADLSHAQAGKFFPGYPLTSATPETVGRYVGEVSVQSSSYALTIYDMLLATVSRTTGTATVVDARTPLVPNVDALLIDNSRVADNAGIAESKLALSEGLQNAKSWAHRQNTDTYTTASAFYVNGSAGSGGKRVLTTDDIVNGGGAGSKTDAVTAASLNPQSATVVVGQTTTLTGSHTAPAGVTVTKSYTSSDTSKATVDSTTGVVTGVAAGTASITYTASSSGNTAYSAASKSAVATITVRAAGTNDKVLTTLTSGTTNNAVTVKVGETYSIEPHVTVPTGVTAAPTYTFVSSDAGKATVSATGRVTGVAPGTTVITITATQAAAIVGSTTYDATTLTATLSVTVTNNLVLVPEPNFRTVFSKVSTTAGYQWEGIAYWGIKGTAGTAADNNTAWRISVSNHDVFRTIPTGGLRDCVLVDSANNAFRITDNDQAVAVPSGGSATAFNVSVEKGSVTPATGACKIRSQASGLGLSFYSIRNSVTSESSTRDWPTASISAMYQEMSTAGIPGQKYVFRLTGRNSQASPTEQTAEYVADWGAADDSAPVVNIGAITATPTTNSVKFEWASPVSFDRDTMNYQCAIQVNGQPTTPVYNILATETATTGKQATGSYQHVASSGDAVKIYARVIDGAERSLSGTIATAQASVTRANTNTTQQFDVSFVGLTKANFESSSGSSIGDGSPSYVIGEAAKTILERFNVVAIGLKFTNFTSSQSSLGIKARVYPRGNPGASISSSFVTSNGGTPSVLLEDVSFLSSLDGRTTLSVALERTPTDMEQEFGTFNITGVVTIHYQISSANNS